MLSALFGGRHARPAPERSPEGTPRREAEQERNLERSIELLSTKYYEQIPYTSQRGVETILSHLEKENPKAKTADPKSFYDDSLLREIEASGFVKALYQK